MSRKTREAFSRLAEKANSCQNYQLDDEKVLRQCYIWWEEIIQKSFPQEGDKKEQFVQLMRWAVYQEGVLKSGGRCRMDALEKNPDEEFRKAAAQLRSDILIPLCNQANKLYQQSQINAL